jgi:hypothetical protein
MAVYPPCWYASDSSQGQQFINKKFRSQRLIDKHQGAGHLRLKRCPCSQRTFKMGGGGGKCSIKEALLYHICYQTAYLAGGAMNAR